MLGNGFRPSCHPDRDLYPTASSHPYHPPNSTLIPTACRWAPQEREDEEPFASLKEPDARKALVAELHKLKTDIFMDMVEAGSMPLRPGVARLVGAPLCISACGPTCLTLWPVK